VRPSAPLGAAAPGRKPAPCAPLTRVFQVWWGCTASLVRKLSQGGIMRKLLLIGVLATVSLGVMLGIATATPPGGDFAAGNGSDGIGHFNFRAQQTTTNLASGRMSYRSPTEVIRANVICLNVQGDLGFILGEIDQSRSSGVPGGAERVAFEVRDAPGADK